MSDSPLDTNVILRFLVEDPKSISPSFRGVYSFFEKLERGEQQAFLPDLVLFQAYFVLTSYYGVPGSEAAQKLSSVISFRGIRMSEKHVAANCLDRLRSSKMDLVDAWLVAWCDAHHATAVFSFDAGLRKLGLKLLPVR